MKLEKGTVKLFIMGSSPPPLQPENLVVSVSRDPLLWEEARWLPIQLLAMNGKAKSLERLASIMESCPLMQTSLPRGQEKYH